MTAILQSLSKTVHISLAIAFLLLLGLHFGGEGFSFDRYFFSWLFRYLHVLTGIMWIGLLWYFNFVQIPSMPNIPDESVPIGKNEDDNILIKECGSINTSNKLDHLEITPKIDTELAAKLAGSRFAVLKGGLAKLQRSLITFML